MKESGVLEQNGAGLRSDERAAGSAVCASRLSGLTMAEYFRDEERQDVLLFIDNIFRFTQAGSEVSALLGRMPSAVGYQPTLANEMGALAGAHHVHQKGFHHVGSGGLRPRGRPDRPCAGNNVRASRRNDGSFAVRSPRRAFTRRSIRWNPPAAFSPPDVVGEEHYSVAREVQRILQRYQELMDIIAIMGMDELSDEDKLAGCPREKDSALPVAAVLRLREVHRLPRRLRSAF